MTQNEPGPGVAETSGLQGQKDRAFAAEPAISVSGPHTALLQEDDAAEFDEIDEPGDGYVRVRSGFLAIGATVVSVLILALLAGNVYQFLHYRSEATIATVNGAAISQTDFDRAAGPADQALQSLIDQKLIQQEAKRQKVSVPDADVTAEIATLKQQLGSEAEFAAALSRANLTEVRLRDQIRMQKLAQRIGAKGVTVNDDEVQTYFNQNKAQFGTQTFDQAKDQIKVQILQSKQNEAIQGWIAGLRQRFKDQIKVHIPA